MMLASGSAKASNIWDWGWSSANHSGTGSLTEDGAGLITAISGTWDGFTITGLLPLTTCCGSPANDNVWLDGSVHLTLGGVGFSDSNGDNVNIYSNSGALPYFVLGTAANTNEAGDFSVPEPASMALFGAGLLGLGWVRRRRA